MRKSSVWIYLNYMLFFIYYDDLDYIMMFLIMFDWFEKGLEVIFIEIVVIYMLDYFDEDRIE